MEATDMGATDMGATDMGATDMGAADMWAAHMWRDDTPGQAGLEPGALVLRRAVDGDADAVAEVWLRSFAAALPGVRRAHTDDEVRSWFRDFVVPAQESWVALVADAVVGILVLDGEGAEDGDGAEGGELEQLYLDPDWRGRGIGDQLVELAKRRRTNGLTLWTFQVNAPARRFYERHGFVAVEHTDGRRNEEREPDVRYVWGRG